MSNTEVSVGPYSNDNNRSSTNRKSLKDSDKNAHRCANLYAGYGDWETRVDFVETWKDCDQNQTIPILSLGVDLEVRNRKLEKTNSLALNLSVLMFLSIAWSSFVGNQGGNLWLIARSLLMFGNSKLLHCQAARSFSSHMVRKYFVYFTSLWLYGQIERFHVTS